VGRFNEDYQLRTIDGLGVKIVDKPDGLVTVEKSESTLCSRTKHISDIVLDQKN
jgi:hypothetical protein